MKTIPFRLLYGILISTYDMIEKEFEVGKKKKKKREPFENSSWASKAGVVLGFAGMTGYRCRCPRAHKRAECGWQQLDVTLRTRLRLNWQARLSALGPAVTILSVWGRSEQQTGSHLEAAIQRWGTR